MNETYVKGAVDRWTINAGDGIDITSLANEELSLRLLILDGYTGPGEVDSMHALLGKNIGAELFPTPTHPDYRKDINALVTAVITSQPNEDGEVFCKIYGEVLS